MQKAENSKPVNRRAPRLNAKGEIRNPKQFSNFPNPNDQNRVIETLSSNVLNIGEFVFRICPSTWLRMVSWSNHLVLALWNSAMFTPLNACPVESAGHSTAAKSV